MRLSDMEKVSKLELLDLLFLEAENGTRAIFAEDLAKSVFELVGKDGNDDGSAREAYFEMLDGVANTEIRKNTFRGKLLGTEVTQEQYANIADGTFKGFFVGDYWQINGHTWRIADFDYFYDSGQYDTDTHHLLMMPDQRILTGSLKDGTPPDISGAFFNTKFFTHDGDNNSYYTQIVNNYLKPCFGDTHLLPFFEYISNKAVNGMVTGYINYEAKVLIPNETMIFGTVHASTMTSENTRPTHHNTTAATQLSLFRIDPYFIRVNHDSYWLSDIATDLAYVYVTGSRNSHFTNANSATGIRPYFCLKG